MGVARAVPGFPAFSIVSLAVDANGVYAGGTATAGRSPA
jgi:hypothetical protein